MKNLFVILTLVLVLLFGLGLYEVVFKINNIELLQYCTAEYTNTITYCKNDAFSLANEKAKMAIFIYSFVVAIISALVLFKIKQGF